MKFDGDISILLGAAKDNDLIDLARYDNYLTEIKKYIENLVLNIETINIL